MGKGEMMYLRCLPGVDIQAMALGDRSRRFAVLTIFYRAARRQHITMQMAWRQSPGSLPAGKRDCREKARDEIRTKYPRVWVSSYLCSIGVVSQTRHSTATPPGGGGF